MKKLIDVLTAGYLVFYATSYAKLSFSAQPMVGKVIIVLTMLLAATHVFRVVKPICNWIVEKFKTRKAKHYLAHQVMFLI